MRESMRGLVFGDMNAVSYNLRMANMYFKKRDEYLITFKNRSNITSKLLFH